jgi:hypothetical protein
LLQQRRGPLRVLRHRAIEFAAEETREEVRRERVAGIAGRLQQRHRIGAAAGEDVSASEPGLRIGRLRIGGERGLAGGDGAIDEDLVVLEATAIAARFPRRRREIATRRDWIIAATVATERDDGGRGHRRAGHEQAGQEADREVCAVPEHVPSHEARRQS